MIPWIQRLAIRLNITSNRTNSPNYKAKSGDIIVPPQEDAEFKGINLTNNRAEGNDGDGFGVEGDIPIRGYGNVAKDNKGKGFNIKR
jgi:hypothetical protein